MALTPCLACGESISSTAPQCPHCRVSQPVDPARCEKALAVVLRDRRMDTPRGSADDAFPEATVTCPECSSSSSRLYTGHGDDFPSIRNEARCRKCGYAQSWPPIRCSDPDCSSPATRVQAIEGRWQAVCREHTFSRCDGCRFWSPAVELEGVTTHATLGDTHSTRHRGHLCVVITAVSSRLAKERRQEMDRRRLEEAAQAKRDEEHRQQMALEADRRRADEFRSNGRCTHCGQPLSVWRLFVARTETCSACPPKTAAHSG